MQKDGLLVVKLHRDIETDDGTFGTLNLNGKVLCHTLEDRWRDNEPRVSCIPKGRYLCVPHNGAKWKNVWEITRVPNRSAILIHSGNTEFNTVGCVLVGTAVGKIDTKYGLVGSRDALDKLRKQLPYKFWIEIS